MPKTNRKFERLTAVFIAISLFSMIAILFYEPINMSGCSRYDQSRYFHCLIKENPIGSSPGKLFKYLEKDGFYKNDHNYKNGIYRTSYRYDYSLASRINGGGFLINTYYKRDRIIGVSTSNSDRIGINNSK